MKTPPPPGFSPATTSRPWALTNPRMIERPRPRPPARVASVSTSAAVGDELLAGGAEGAGLGHAASLGDGLGEVGKDDGEEKLEGDLEDVAERIFGGEELLERKDGPDERDEHHGVFKLGARVEFFEGVDDRLAQDGAVEKGGALGAHVEGGTERIFIWKAGNQERRGTGRMERRFSNLLISN